MESTRHQQKTIAYLKQYIVQENVLKARCPLDYGKHDCVNSSVAPLGSLDILPTELQQGALSFLDIKSLLTFRRVNKLAMNLVNTSSEHHKVVPNAPMALRMAIALAMHDKYTISELFSVLCQRTCADCGTPAHYICIFTCRRICLGQNGFCEGNLPPWRILPTEPGPVQCDQSEDQDRDMTFRFAIQERNIDPMYSAILIQSSKPIPTFKPIPGAYGLVRYAHYVCLPWRWIVKPGDVFVDINHLSKEDREYFRGMWRPYPEDMVGVKTFSVVVAPWLSKTSMDSVYGIQCRICVLAEKPRVAVIDWPSLMSIPQCEIWTEEGMVKHMREAHGVSGQ